MNELIEPGLKPVPPLEDIVLSSIVVIVFNKQKLGLRQRFCRVKIFKIFKICADIHINFGLQERFMPSLKGKQSFLKPFKNRKCLTV